MRGLVEVAHTLKLVLNEKQPYTRRQKGVEGMKNKGAYSWLKHTSFL
jgi:hypothetical protein